MPLTWLWIGRLTQLICVTLLLLFTMGIAAEGLLRLGGLRPLASAQVHSDIVPDSYAGWRMRPNVRTIREQSITNNLGSHARQDYSLEPAPNVERVIVQGSSVVYGSHCGLGETLPQQLEEALSGARGHTVEVLNFGVHGYSLLNTLGQTSAYALQFQPRAAVIMLDIQMCYPEEPIPVPKPEPTTGGVKQLDLAEAWLRRGAMHSALLAAVATPDQVQRRVRSFLPIRPATLEKAETPPSVTANQLSTTKGSANPSAGINPEAAEVGGKSPALARSRRLRSVLAGVLAAYAESGVATVVVTPWGPYYQGTDAVLAQFALHHVNLFVGEYGGFRQAVHGELARMRVDVETVARDYGAALVDMTSENLKLTADTPPYFLRDGIHPSPVGYRYLASRIAPVLLEAMNGNRQKGN